ncbi:proteasome subunit beta type-2-like [Cloeon dipterum]|uniref:proteasome subunit beta type-2-like n=1 Tax=Cloeon dipterum TaxID=197152 RepID=UPI0032207BE8
MECLIGIAFKDYVLIAADMTNAHSILVMKNDESKLFKLSSQVVMAVSGESGDTTQFAEYIAKNMQLYKMRNSYELSPQSIATYTRKNLADSLRSRSPYMVNLLIGGYDKDEGAQLYFMDYLASMVKVPFAAHGYGGYFSLSIMDRLYRPDLPKEEGYKVMVECVKECHRRLIVNLPNFKVQMIDANGITDLPIISAKQLAINSSPEDH